MEDLKPFHNLATVLRRELCTLHNSQNMWHKFAVPGHANVDPGLYQATEYDDILTYSLLPDPDRPDRPGRSVNQQATIRNEGTIRRLLKEALEEA